MVEFYVEPNTTTIPLGRQGENLARTIYFELSELISNYGEGTATLVYLRSRDSAPYVCDTTQSGNMLSWTPTDTDTAYAGAGKCELRWSVGEVLAKSIVYNTVIAPSVSGDSVVPSEYESWYEALLEHISKYEIASDQIETNAENIATNTNDIAVLDGRVDELTTLPEGSTTGDAELADIRVGADGTQYETAGKAVRTQITDLKKYINYIECPNLMGADLTRLYPVYIKSGEKFTVSTSDGSTFDGTNRIYYYDVNRNVIDWSGLYTSYGSKRTLSIDSDIFYMSWYTRASTAPRYMVNIGDKALPYVEYYNDPKQYGYKGRASNPLSDIRVQGYYAGVNYDGTITDLPDNYGDWHRGMLEVYSIGTANGITVQKLLNGSGKTWVRTINTQTGAIGQWVQYAVNDDVVTDTNTIRLLLHNALLSMSGNYFDREKAEWQEGFINPDGTVNPSTGYHYAYAQLHGAGEYVRVVRYDNFGTNALNIQLFDVNKTYIKTKTGTRVGVTNSVAFTLTEDEARSAAYTVINVKDEYMFVCGLFFESDNYNYIGLRTPNANFGETTNLLYKKTLVCDGDSICAAALDKPYEENGWFGRLKNSYSMTGKNYGVGGGTITAETYFENGSKRHWVSTSIDTIKEAYPSIDYLILEGGTNDADLIGRFNNDTPPAKFGTWSETDFSGDYDNTTFCGALDSLFYKAVTYYPTAKIGFIVAMEMGTNNSTIANRRRYFDEATKIATKWHIPVLDLWKEIHADARLAEYYDSTMTEGQNVSAKKFYNDGQHPTSYGYDLMQKRIDSWVQSL